MAGRLATGFGCKGGLFTATQAVDVKRGCIDFRLAQTANPGRHHAETRMAHGFFDRLGASAIKPDGIRQVGRAKDTVPRTGIAMARGAIVEEESLASTGKRAVVGMACGVRAIAIRCD